MSEFEITDQDQAVLDLIAKGESAAGAEGYTSVYPGKKEPSLIQMTLAEVDRYQSQRISQGVGSSAVGRYQFIQGTLRSAVGILKVDPLRTRYTPQIQDSLILSILKSYRKLDEWKAGNYPTDKFMIKLAQEFASMPVPYAMQGHKKRPLQKGQSYYAGDGLNKANHDPDTVFRELEDIRTGGKGNVAKIPLGPDGSNGALAAGGTSPKAKVANSASGGGVGSYVGGNPGSRPLPASQLPSSSGTVYQYRLIDPLDDRYDFRTGEKVRDILIHGTGAVASSPVVNGNIGAANVSTTNIGVEPPSTNTDTVVKPDGNGSTYDEEKINKALSGGQSQDPAAIQNPTEREPKVDDSKAPSEPTRQPCPEPVTTKDASIDSLQKLSNKQLLDIAYGPDQNNDKGLTAAAILQVRGETVGVPGGADRQKQFVATVQKIRAGS